MYTIKNYTRYYRQNKFNFNKYYGATSLQIHLAKYEVEMYLVSYSSRFFPKSNLRCEIIITIIVIPVQDVLKN